MPRGRPKKVKGFRVSSKKVEKANDIDFTMISNVRETINRPLGLLNYGDNVCFFNSVIQVLHSIKPFREFVLKTQSDGGAILAMKDLFREIDTSKEPIETSRYISRLPLVNYDFGRQYDAHECLIQLLDLFYPQQNEQIPDNCIFKISTFESVLCNCQYSIDQNKGSLDLQVNLEDTDNVETISGLIDMMLNAHGEPLLDYTCDKCHGLNTSTKSFNVTNTPNYMILHLCIFTYDSVNGTVRKIVPRLTIDDEIHLWGNTMSLHAVIYHQGEECNSGHYTAGVRIEDQWFLTNDSSITNEVKLKCTDKDLVVPYILVYKKRNDLLVPIYPNVRDNDTLTLEMKNEHSIVQMEGIIAGTAVSASAATPFTDNIDAMKKTVVTVIDDIESSPISEIKNKTSLLNELEKQTKRIKKIEEEKRKTEKLRIPVKRKSKYSEKTKRMKNLRKNLDDDQKEIATKTAKILTSIDNDDFESKFITSKVNT